MRNTIITTTTEVTATRKRSDAAARESDGRFALQMRTTRSVQRMMRRDAEREARRRELEEMYGDDACMYA